MTAGTVIAERYELGERLGMGGMSTVQVAFDRRLEREVAIKLLAEHLAHDPQFVTRFRREALAAARLVHPNIVQVFDFGLDEASGRHFIVMERIAGPSGAQVLRERGSLPLEEAVDWIAQACRGLDEAHRHGLVHRDVKPGNLLLSTADGTVKLADFGIVKGAGDESGVTQVGSVLGTAAYLAPEQAAGEDAGPAADLYGLGVVAYQMLSGRLPYEAQSLTELVLKQQRETPVPLHVLDPAIPVALSSAVARALSLDPRRRYRSAAEMREAVVDGARGIGAGDEATTMLGGPLTDAATTALAGDPGTGPVVVPRAPRQPRGPATPASAPSPVPASGASGRGRSAPPPRRRGPSRTRMALRRLVSALLLLAVLAAGAAAIYVASNQSRSAVQLRRVTGDHVNEVVDRMTRLIEDNTR